MRTLRSPRVVLGWAWRGPKGNGGIAGLPGQRQKKESMWVFISCDGLFGKVFGGKIQVG